MSFYFIRGDGYLRRLSEWQGHREMYAEIYCPECCTSPGRIPHAAQPAPGCIFAAAMRPHSLSRRFVSLLLAVLVLITSVGLTVQRLTCRMSGQSIVAVSVVGGTELHGCMGMGELAPATSKAQDGCCDFSKHQHKLSSPVHELAAKTLVPTPSMPAIVPPLSWPAPTAAVGLLATGGPRWFAADASPPPLGGRTLLAFVCILEV